MSKLFVCNEPKPFLWKTVSRTSCIASLPFICFLLLSTAALANRYYVDNNRPDNSGAGTSWATAKKEVQDAIDLAQPGDSVWVKTGTYYPTVFNGSVASFDNRNKTIYVKSGVKLFGGFAGTETIFSQRNVTTNITRLSGNIGNPDSTVDNSYHIVVISNRYSTTIGAVVDGFVIEGANANSQSTSIFLNNNSINNSDGAGLYCVKGSQNSILNNTFNNNTATNFGGGIYIASDSTIASCTIKGNTINNNIADYGGGAYANKTTCNFNDNKFTADSAVTFGGGLYYVSNQQGVIEFNTFNANKGRQSFSSGGAMFMSNGSYRIINNTIRNSKAGKGAGVYFIGTSNTVLLNNLIENNNANLDGGGIYIHSTGFCSIAGNTIVSNNNNGNGGGLYNGSNSSIPVESNIFWNNRSYNNPLANTADFGSGNGLTVMNNNLLQLPPGSYSTTNFNGISPFSSGNIFAISPKFTDSTDADGPDNIDCTADDGFTLQAISPCINTGRLTANSTFAEPFDILYETRVFPDMGAYEKPEPCPAGTVLYVDSTIAIAGNGQTWATAFKELSDALAVAWNCSNINTIQVAKGTYYPRRKPYNMRQDKKGVEITDFTSSNKIFHVRQGISVLGGFAPGGTSRNPAAYITALDGSQGSSHIVLMDSSGIWAKANDTTLIDGCYIRNGNTNNAVINIIVNGNSIFKERGAGIFISSGTNAVSNCVFQNNVAAEFGGGVFTQGSGSSFFNYNTFTANSGNEGGAMYLNGSNHTVTGTIFKNNNAQLGGAIKCVNGMNRFLQSVFTGNGAVFGGAIYFFNTTSTLQNNLFAADTASVQGGAVFFETGNYQVDNNTFYGNKAGQFGGAVYCNDNPVVTYRNSIFWNNKQNNSATIQGVDFYNAISPATNSNFYNNALQLIQSAYTVAGHNGLSAASANNLFAQSPKFAESTDTDGPDNLFRTTDDGLQLKKGSPCINTGTAAAGIPATDILDILRTNPDIGAYELVICPGFTQLYVDSSRAVSGNGNSWATAFKSLDTAIYLLWQCPSINTIHVAKGTYKPKQFPYQMQADRTGVEITETDTALRTFHLRPGTRLYGGYPTGGGFRNGGANITRLSGDIDIAGNNDCYHVVIMDCSNLWGSYTDSTLIDGFFISGGNARPGNLEITLNDKPLISYSGGGILANYGSNYIRNNTIQNNKADSDGAGIYYEGDESGFGRINITANQVLQNKAEFGNGGGMYIASGASTINNNTVTGNTAEYGGGIATNKSVSTITGNTITNDTAWSGGGGIHVFGRTVFIERNVVRLNKCYLNGGGVSTSGTGANSLNLTMDGNTVSENQADYGAGMYLGGDFQNLYNNLFAKNMASAEGGAMQFFGNTNSRITNNSFVYNTAIENGGGINVAGATQNAQLANNIFWGNQLSGRTDTAGADFTALNYNFFYNNLLQLSDSLKYQLSTANGLATGSVKNLFAIRPDFYDTADINGPDNIYNTSDDGFSLQSQSMTINGGDNSKLTGITNDLASKPRFSNVIIDIGAYEFGNANCTLSTVNTWLGVVSTSWNVANNWSCSSIPGATSEVLIRGLVPNMPLVNVDVTIRKLTVKPTAALTVAVGKKLTITGQ